MWKNLIVLALGLSIFSACSTVPYNPRRDVKVKRTWYGTSYKQGDNYVNPADIATKLGRKPQHKEKIESFNSNYRFSQAFGLLGSFAIGWSAGGGFDETGTLIGGLLLVGGAIFFDKKANDILSPLVTKRNAMVYNYQMLDYRQVLDRKNKKIMVPIYSYNF